MRIYLQKEAITAKVHLNTGLTTEGGGEKTTGNQTNNKSILGNFIK